MALYKWPFVPENIARRQCLRPSSPPWDLDIPWQCGLLDRNCNKPMKMKVKVIEKRTIYEACLVLPAYLPCYLLAWCSQKKCAQFSHN